MTTGLQLAYSQDEAGKPAAPSRRSLSEAFAAAAAGAPPRQPHNDGDLLIAEAFIAQETLKKIGRLVNSDLHGIFEIGPEKDLARAKAKTKERGDLALNCDFSRARVLLRDVEQIKKAIDLFGQTGLTRLGKGDKAIEVNIVDVDNTFSRPSPKKPGLCNLDVKIALPITLDTGEESYHICEVQFLHKGTKATYKKSHEIYEEARSELIRRQFIENAMDMAGCPETAKNLEKRWHKADKLYNELMQKREDLNTGIAEKLGLNALRGYQPCNTNTAKSLQCSTERVYEVR
jgi:hypothetical protein